MTGADSRFSLLSMRIQEFSLLIISTLALMSCQAAPAQQQESAPDMPKNPVPIVEQVSALDNIPVDRLQALEARVVTLESQMGAAQPELKKVAVIESHFRALSLELDSIEAGYNLTQKATVQKKVVQIKPEMKPVSKAPPQKTIAQKPVSRPQFKKETTATDQTAAVTSIRIGEQKSDVTRIVLDTTKPAELHYDLDNNEGLLVVDLPGNKWQAKQDMNLASSPMVKSFHGRDDENGAHLVLQLKQKAKVRTTARLKPSGSYGNRVYFDIVPEK